jgi:hypothetical protein
VNFVWNEGELKTCLRDKDPKSPWLQYELVRELLR